MNMIALFFLLFGDPFVPGDPFHVNLHQLHVEEYSIIMNAAERNGIDRFDHENIAILFAIRKVENGRKGREFGVLHPRALGEDSENRQVTLDRQAGWAAATIMKNRKRWIDAGMKEDFLVFLGSRYAPIDVENDPKGLNRHWIPNMRKHVRSIMAFSKRPTVA